MKDINENLDHSVYRVVMPTAKLKTMTMNFSSKMLSFGMDELPYNIFLHRCCYFFLHFFVTIRLPSASLWNDKTESVKFNDHLECQEESCHQTASNVETIDENAEDQDHNKSDTDLTTIANRIQDIQIDDDNKKQFSSRCEYSLSLCAKDTNKSVVPSCKFKSMCFVYLTINDLSFKFLSISHW